MDPELLVFQLQLLDSHVDDQQRIHLGSGLLTTSSHFLLRVGLTELRCPTACAPPIVVVTDGVMVSTAALVTVSPLFASGCVRSICTSSSSILNLILLKARANILGEKS